MRKHNLLLSLFACSIVASSAMADDLSSRLAGLNSTALMNAEMDAVQAKYLQDINVFLIGQLSQGNQNITNTSMLNILGNSQGILSAANWEDLFNASVPDLLAQMPVLEQSPIMNLPSVYLP